MAINYYYKKGKPFRKKQALRIVGALVSVSGFLILLYVSFPLLLWQVVFAPVFASQDLSVPIPKTTVLNQAIIKNLLADGAQTFTDVDYADAVNWFPNLKIAGSNATSQKVPFYTLSIPKLHISNATVSTIDNDLNTHLVNYPGTAIPDERGNAVIFGHSTLPQLFNPRDYKTIFANAYQLTTGDVISTNIAGISYQYRIYAITVVDPSDTSAFAQDYANKELTLITCTPPGTTWKRLIIKARFEKI